MRGGRSFSRVGRGGSSYRGNSNSNYHSNSYNSSGYENTHSNGGRYRGGGGGYGGRDSYEHSYDSRNSRYEGHSNPHRYSNARTNDFNKRQFHQSSRDRSVDRKRPRYNEGSRRSLEYGGNSSTDYGNNRYNENPYRRPYESSSRSAERPATFRPRETVSSQRSRERMAPPKSLPPRRPRGTTTYRGRSSILRGIRRPPPPTQIVLRKKYLSLKSRSETARRVKIARLRSTLLKKNNTTGKKSSEPEDDDPKADGSSKEKEDIDAEEDPESPTKKSTKPTVKSNEANEMGTDVSVKDESDVDENINDEKNDDSETRVEAGYKSMSKSYIKLVCVHCNIKCLTFKEYSHHLYSRQHKLSLKRLSLRQKAQLARMRLSQRNTQREIEESTKDNDDLNSQFCLLCRLNYRSEKSDHQASESHRKMKKFLMPYCTICRIGFKSPMEYETHNCSIDHIKRTARQTNEKTTASENECEVDLEQFTTVDSIGDVDDHNENVGELLEKKEDNGSTDDIKSKTEINVGNEHVNKVEVYYCELCRYYLPFNDDQATVLSRHCASRSHLRSYLRYKENENLRMAAEKIHRRHQQEREERRARAAKLKAEVRLESTSTKKDNDENEDNVEDKIWADVDKDLGELLQEVGNIEENDNEDEDSTATERYDRFKNSGVADSAEGEENTRVEGELPKTADNLEDALVAASGNNAK